DEEPFYSMAIVLAPALLILALVAARVIGMRIPDVLALRYFVGSIAFFLILVSYVLANWLRGRPAAKLLALCLVGVFLAGNGWHTARLLRWGRAHYSSAMLFMAENTIGPVVSYDGDRDATPGVVEFYAKYLPHEKTFVRVLSRPEWILFHRRGVPV